LQSNSELKILIVA